MRREAEQGMTLGTRLEHKVDVAVFEVAYAAVDQPGRPARGTPREIGFVDQRHSEPAGGGLVGDAAPRNPAADNQEVELAGAERFQALPSRRNAGLH